MGSILGLKVAEGGESCHPVERVCGEAVLLSHFTENPLSILEGCWVSESKREKGSLGPQS